MNRFRHPDQQLTPSLMGELSQCRSSLNTGMLDDLGHVQSLSGNASKNFLCGGITEFDSLVPICSVPITCRITSDDFHLGLPHFQIGAGFQVPLETPKAGDSTLPRRRVAGFYCERTASGTAGSEIFRDLRANRAPESLPWDPARIRDRDKGSFLLLRRDRRDCKWHRQYSECRRHSCLLRPGRQREPRR